MGPISHQSFTPRDAVRVLFVAILTCGFAYYAYFQAHNLILGPSLTLSEEQSQLQHEMLVELRGVAENVVTLTVNGKPITTNERGVFMHPLVLEQGYTIVTLIATDRYGRTATLTRSFVYQPPEGIGV
jgi:hypothetical protein